MRRHLGSSLNLLQKEKEESCPSITKLHELSFCLRVAGNRKWSCPSNLPRFLQFHPRQCGRMLPSKQGLTGPRSFQAAHGTEVQSLWAVSCCFISVMYPTAGVWLMHRCCKAQLDRIQSNKTTKQTEECNSGRINIPCNLCQGYMFNSFPLYCRLFESHRVRADIFIALSV